MKPGIDTKLFFALVDGEGRYWSELPLLYAAHKGSKILIRAGFMSDGASIPKIFQSLFSKTGKYLWAAVLHDYGYRKDFPHHMTRKEVDKLFLFYMREYGVGWFTRHTIYRAVRLGGFAAWKKHYSEYAET